MDGVLALETAVLAHFNALTVIDLVLGRDVVTTLAVLTLKGDLDPLFVLSHLFLLFSRLLRGGSGGGIRTRDNTIMSRVL